MNQKEIEQASSEVFFERAKRRMFDQTAASCQIAIVFMLMAIYTLLRDRMAGD